MIRDNPAQNHGNSAERPVFIGYFASRRKHGGLSRLESAGKIYTVLSFSCRKISYPGNHSRKFLRRVFLFGGFLEPFRGGAISAPKKTYPGARERHREKFIFAPGYKDLTWCIHFAGAGRSLCAAQQLLQNLVGDRCKNSCPVPGSKKDNIIVDNTWKT